MRMVDRRTRPSAHLWRALLVVASCAAMLAAWRAQAQGTDWQPTRPIEIVVPSAPGGGLDITGRTLQRLVQEGKYADYPATVVNKAGGSGTIGIAYINQHKADGHYICVQSPALLTNGITGTSAIGLKDVTPIALLVTEDIIFSVGADSPIKTGGDLVAQMKRDPASVSIAVSSSPGGHSHVAAALLAKAIGSDPKTLKMVFFGSGGEATTALMGGHVTVALTPASSILGHRQAGRVRVIGIAAASRLSGPFADVPTWKEQGVDIEFYAWRSLVGPRGMTPAQLAWWDATLAKVTASPQWQTDVERNQWTSNYKNSAETAAFFAAEHDKLAAVLGELGLAK
jgi:putative tricarboxylic transport membrane protein